MSRNDCWEQFRSIMSLAPNERAGPVLLHGKTGTGKTRAALSLGLQPGERVIYTVLTEETSAAELRGHWIQYKSSFRFLKGPCLAAWTQSARLVLDEADKLSGDSLSLMLSILDDPGHARYRLPWGREIRPKNGFFAIATMNGDPRALPVPFVERFAHVIHIDRPNPEALMQLPRDIRELAKKADPFDDPERRNSLRTWFRFATLRDRIGEEQAAFQLFGKRSPDLLAALASMRAL